MAKISYIVLGGKMEIQFSKLEFVTTFTDIRTQKRWVKYDETGAVREDDPYDTVGVFGPTEKVIIDEVHSPG